MNTETWKQFKVSDDNIAASLVDDKCCLFIEYVTRHFYLAKLTAENLWQLTGRKPHVKVIPGNDVLISDYHERWIVSRDASKCVICSDTSSLIASHIVDIQVFSQNSQDKQCAVYAATELDGFYQVHNGITLCNLCHTMYEHSILSIYDVNASCYIATCIEGCFHDPLFVHQVHARKIHKRRLRVPENILAWPKVKTVQWRHEINTKKMEQRQRMDTAKDYECLKCGMLFSALKGLTSHRTYTRKCSNLRLERTVGRYGGFDLVRVPDEDRRKRSEQTIKEFNRQKRMSRRKNEKNTRNVEPTSNTLYV